MTNFLSFSRYSSLFFEPSEQLTTLDFNLFNNGPKLVIQSNSPIRNRKFLDHINHREDVYITLKTDGSSTSNSKSYFRIYKFVFDEGDELVEKDIAIGKLMSLAHHKPPPYLSSYMEVGIVGCMVLPGAFSRYLVLVNTIVLELTQDEEGITNVSYYDSKISPFSLTGVLTWVSKVYSRILDDLVKGESNKHYYITKNNSQTFAKNVIEQVTYDMVTLDQQNSLRGFSVSSTNSLFPRVK